MGAKTAIEWTDATWNAWRGCSRKSPGCEHCYAESLANRFPATFGRWGKDAPRVVATETSWQWPIRRHTNVRPGRDGRRYLVFVNDVSDWLEDHRGPLVQRPANASWIGPDGLGHRMWAATWGDPKGHPPWRWYPESSRNPDDHPDGSYPLTLDDCRLRMLDVIRRTPGITYQLLTKRPELWRPTLMRLAGRCEGRRASEVWETLRLVTRWLNGDPPANVWVGTTVEDRKRAAERLPLLRAIPAVVRFLSCEPLLEDLGGLDLGGIGWVIVGGESGPEARGCNLRWIREVVQQCRAAGVPCFVKQAGSRPYVTEFNPNAPAFDDDERFLKLKDKKGGDLSELPVEIQVREFPR